MTKEQAIALYDTKWWEDVTDREAIEVQLFEARLIMPFNELHKRITAVLGRPVWTHEFAFRDKLQAEFLGDRPAPTMEEIMDLIPADKRIVIAINGDDQ